MVCGMQTQSPRLALRLVCRDQVMKLEAALLRCEQQRDELGDRVFHVRAESQAKIKHLRGTLQVRAARNLDITPSK